MHLADIKQHWNSLAIELIKLHQDDSYRGCPDWIIEDVYAACLYGFAKLYVCDEGYLIFKKDGNEFVIWFALSTRPGEFLMDKYFGQICDVAEETGATRMAFYTTRKGYDKIIDQGGLPGFRFQHSKYVRGI